MLAFIHFFIYMIIVSLIVVIARRLWLYSKNETGDIKPYRSLRFVGRVFTESGLLYLTITVIHLVAWFTPSAYAISVISNIVSI